MKTLRTPKKKEARQFVQAMQSMLVMIQQPSAATGEHVENVVMTWTQKLTNMTDQEAEDLEPAAMIEYQTALIGMLDQMQVQPPKKR